MLTSPRTVLEVSRSSVLPEEGGLIAFPSQPLEKSGVELLTLRHTCWPWRSFRLGWTFSSMRGCLRRKTGTKHRALGSPALVTELLKPCSTWLRRLLPRGSQYAALIAIAVIASNGVPRPVWALDATWSMTPAAGNNFNDPGNWVGDMVPTGIASFGPTSMGGDVPLITENTTLNEFHFLAGAPSYDFLIESPHTLTFTNDGVAAIKIDILVSGDLVRTLARCHPTFSGGGRAGSLGQRRQEADQRG